MPGFYQKLARSPGASLAAIGVLLCLATIALFLADLQSRYRERIAAAKTDAQNFAKILAEHTALTFDDVDKALLEAETIRNSAAGRYSAPGPANAALRELKSGSSLLVAIGWTDASGDLLAHSYRSEPARRNISDMPHFIAQRDNPDAGLFIAPPYRSAVSDRWLTAASRRINNPDGSFAGVVTAPIDQAYFTKLYQSIDLGRDGSVILMHREGRIMAREPELKAALGKSFADLPLFTKFLPVSDVGSFEMTSTVNGVDRIAGYKTVPGLPLVLLVTYARSDVLEPWYRHAFATGLVVIAVVTIIALGTLVLIRQTGKLAAGSRAMARTNARFDVALSNMPHGLSMFDVDERLLVCNARYREIYGLSEEHVRPGTPLRDILKAFEQRCEESDFQLEPFWDGAKQRTPHILRLANGRTICIVRTPMKGGGWVATHEDITDRERADAMLAANAAEVRLINERFDVAISNMSQGLCLFDADKNLVISNRRYQEMYNLPDRLVTPGTPLQKILQHYYDRGERGELSVEEYTEAMPKQSRQTWQLNDGRSMQILRQPLTDGGWVATHEDITDRAMNEKRIAYLAQHDLLTDLANRALFSEKLEQAAERLLRNGSTFSVLMLDLDKFKQVNDTLGRPAGDQLLVQVAQRLSSSLRDTDVLARLGGDEFAIIQENEANQEEGAIGLALRIISLIEEPFDLNGSQVGIGTSIGIAFAPLHGTDSETLLQRADLALYAAKTGGRNDYRIFVPELTEAADTQRSTEAELREAISRDEFELHYQPIFDITTLQAASVEAFVRWRHPSKGLIPPSKFLPLAERTGLIQPLGEWILQRACADAAALPPNVRLAINVAAAQFRKGNLFDLILCALVEAGLSPERLELEISDAGSLKVDAAAHLHTIRQLKNLGVSIVLDNCEVGYSCLQFPFDKVKIDKAFIQGLPARRECAALVGSVVSLARGLEIATTAKGIETREQLEAARVAGVDYVQGDLLARPVEVSELELRLSARSALNVA
jgi:diguanylate cyclase (GGDEF)-like protein